MNGERTLVSRVADLAGDVLRLVQTRLELVGLELQRERNAILLQLKLSMTGVVAAGVAAFSAVLWAALSLPPATRAVALGTLTIAFAAISLASLLIARSQRQRQNQMFHSVITQLRRDRDSLHAKPAGPAREGLSDRPVDTHQSS